MSVPFPSRVVSVAGVLAKSDGNRKTHPRPHGAWSEIDALFPSYTSCGGVTRCAQLSGPGNDFGRAFVNH